MWKHLWTKEPPPPEYVDFLLCERFGWTPEELYATDADIIEQFLVMWSVEQKVDRAKQDPRGRRNADIPT